MAKLHNRAAAGLTLSQESNGPDITDQQRIGRMVLWLLLTGLTAGYIHWLVPEQIALAARVIVWSVVVYLVLRLILALIVAVNQAQTRIKLNHEQYQQQRLLTETQRIQNKKADREANMVITVTQATDQVYLTEIEPTSVTRPLHLAPGRVNGVETDPSPAESQRWAAYHLLHRSSRQASPDLPPNHQPSLAPGQTELPGLVRLVDLLPADLHGDLHNLVLGLRLNDAGQVERLTISLHDLFHTLVAASSGWGKSVFAASLLTQLATCPDPVEFILIDQQESGLAAFKQCDRLRYPLLRQPGEILSALREVYAEATRYRSDLFARCDADNLAEYNHQAEDPLPPVIVAVDEAATLLTADKEISAELKRQTWELRKFGIYQILCLTSAKGTTIDTDHRQQFSSKVQLHANDRYQARLLMDALEATTFPPGRAVIELPKQSLAIVQTPYIDKREVRSLLRPAKERPPAPPVAIPEPDDQECQVLALAGQGFSRSAIAREVFKEDGGNQLRRVGAILEKFGAVTP